MATAPTKDKIRSRAQGNLVPPPRPSSHKPPKAETASMLLEKLHDAQGAAFDDIWAELEQQAPRAAVHEAVKYLAPGNEFRPWAAEVLSDDSLKAVPMDSDDLQRAYTAFVWRWDEPFTWQLSQALQGRNAPQEKFECLMAAIGHNPTLVREALDDRCAIDSLAVPTRTETAFAAEIVKSALPPASARHIEICAGLLVALGGGSAAAARLVSDCAQERRLREEDLRDLRVEIGGAAALRPLRTLVEGQFNSPLKSLRKKALKDWDDATHAARRAFWVRLAMSTAVFGIGLVAALIAIWRFATTGTGDNVWGTGVSFTAGLGAMLVVVYVGPLSDVGSSVADLRDATVRYTSYIHQLHFISALVSSDFAHGSLSSRTLASFEKLTVEATQQALAKPAQE